MLAKCRGFGRMDENISGSAARGICCGFRVQRYGPSYVPSKSAGEQGLNRSPHTRFKLSGCGSSITLKLANNLPTLKVPHLCQTLDAVEQRVPSILGGRERGKAKWVVWTGACDLPGARVPLLDGTICGY
jgi:hypothetical protein